MWRWVALACVVVGCSDEARGPWQSGSRMRARTMVADDGFTTLIGWHDRELDIDCALSTRPAAACAQRAERVVFLDAACTELAVELAEPAMLAWSYDTDAEQVLAFEVDIARTGNEAYFPDPIYGCVAAAVPPMHATYAARRIDPSPLAATTVSKLAQASVHDLMKDPTIADYLIDLHRWDDGAYQLGVSPVSPAAVSIADTSTRLRARYIELGDLEVPVGIHDSVRDEACVPTTIAGGTIRCLPVVRESQAFSDSACTIRPLDSVCGLGGFYVIRGGDGTVAALVETTGDPAPGGCCYGTPDACECHPFSGTRGAATPIDLTTFAALSPRTE